MSRIIFTEIPYAAAVNEKYFFSGQVCFFCFKKSEKLQKCSRCHIAAYCDRTCQMKDFQTNQHKRECPVFQKVAQVNQPMREEIGNAKDVRLVARILAREAKDGGKIDPEELQGFPPGEKVLGLTDLPLSKGMVRKVPAVSLWPLFRSMYGHNSGFYEEFTPIDFHKALIICAMHGLEISFSEEYGTGIYLQFSRTGPELFFTWERQTTLEESWSFNCECPKCMDVGDDQMKRFGLKKPCRRCKSETLVAFSDTKSFLCLDCSSIQKVNPRSDEFLVFEHLDKLQGGDLLYTMRLLTGNNPDPDLDESWELAKEYGKFLHPVKNLLLFRFKNDTIQTVDLSAEHAIELLPDNNLFSLKSLIESVLPTYEYYSATEYSEYASHCATLAAIHTVLHSWKSAVRYLEKASQCYSEILDPEHPKIREIQMKLQDAEVKYSMENDR